MYAKPDGKMTTILAECVLGRDYKNLELFLEAGADRMAGGHKSGFTLALKRGDREAAVMFLRYGCLVEIDKHQPLARDNDMGDLSLDLIDAALERLRHIFATGTYDWTFDLIEEIR